jgi:DNA-directed RNA polymerase subunit RPC12/RpoP
MSEFKYACPVCGQHIKCDSSQAGTQMQCPTCFQKIIVPQAPTDEQKYILTGSKVGGERPLPKGLDALSRVSSPAKTFSGVAAVLIILACIAAAVTFVYRGTIFKKVTPTVGTNSPTVTQGSAIPSQAPLPPKKSSSPLVAPPANDTNWTLNLNGMAIPNSTAAGRLKGQDFVCQHAYFSNGYLSLHDNDLSVSVNFSGAAPEALAGKSLNVTTNAPQAAHINLRWKDGDQNMRESFTNDYAMLLDFDGVNGGHLGGKIYLCTSDEQKSYVVGTFSAEIRKLKPKKQ